MYTVRVKSKFLDVENSNKLRSVDEEYNINTPDRLIKLLGDNPNKTKYVEFISSTKPEYLKREGPRVIIYQSYLYHIGGIETFLYNLLKHYKDRNITLVVNQSEIEPLIRLSEFCDIVVDKIGKRYEADVCILGNYNCQDFLRKCSAKKYYQMIHADWRGIKLNPAWANFTWTKPEKINTIISVSNAAHDGLKETMKYDSEVIYNILEDDISDEGTMVFITLSRATAEKGIYRIIKMAEAFKAAKKPFIWFLGCTIQQAPSDIQKKIKDIPEIIVLPPTADNKKLIKHCDYLVQLSDTESFCYSAFEALQRGVPVILTRFPEAYNIVEEGKNGYLVEMDLSDLDIDKIFNHKPKNVTYTDRCDYDKWEEVFKGEL